MHLLKDIYASEEWVSLNPVDRASLLLVIEGLKKGTEIQAPYGTLMSILRKTGLSYSYEDNVLPYPHVNYHEFRFELNSWRHVRA